MTTFDRIMLIAVVLLSYQAAYNATEAHRHTHEIGCALDYQPLCKWHTVVE